MEHVNNDMDELFRKAGELYPLRTSESDWDGMLGKLRDEISGETGIPYAAPARNNSTKRRWLMLMLIPAFIFSLFYFTRSRVGEKNIQSAGKTNDLAGDKNSPVTRKISKASEQADKKLPAKTEFQQEVAKDATATTQASAAKSGSDGQVDRKPVQILSSQTGAGKDDVATGKITRDAALFQSSLIQTENFPDQESTHDPVQKTLFLSVYSLSEKPSVYGMPLPPSDQKDIILNSETAKTKANKTASTKGIYAALIGGPDWSTIALQSTEQTGYSLGILVGYRFNRRLALETGLLWDKKFYYSDGQHFTKSGTSDPNLVILNVSGNCNMFEIPLDIRYDFESHKGYGFFVKSGISSYLMKQQNYTYNSEYNGAPKPPYDTTYNKSYNYFSAVIQISGGYEHSIGNNTTIRIEPYLKIPLQGIGVGKMPISSMGLYFGISHLFH